MLREWWLPQSNNEVTYQFGTQSTHKIAFARIDNFYSAHAWTWVYHCGRFDTQQGHVGTLPLPNFDSLSVYAPATPAICHHRNDLRSLRTWSSRIPSIRYTIHGQGFGTTSQQPRLRASTREQDARKFRQSTWTLQMRYLTLESSGRLSPTSNKPRNLSTTEPQSHTVS
jgi:hypothetical protein